MNPSISEEQPEVGPSRSPDSPPQPSPPASEEPDDNDLQAIEESLQSRRRRKSIFSAFSSGKTHNDIRHAIRKAQKASRTEQAEMEEQERLDAVATQELERMRPIEESRPQIVIRRGDMTLRDESADHDGAAGPSRSGASEPPQYIWDVLFENQRGIHLFGKAYFSSKTLLPADPSPFTVPSQMLPSASSFTIAEPSKTPSQPNVVHTQSQPRRTAGETWPDDHGIGDTGHGADAQDETQPSRIQLSANGEGQKKPKGGVECHAINQTRSIRTAYDLHTFQTPSPRWKWITTWMMNMRNGTDENGWRYNVVFKKNGWRSHAGPGGVNGYVRRREWVRLRCLSPALEVRTAAVAPELPTEPKTVKTPEMSEVWLRGESLVEILRIVNVDQLDRIKLERWRDFIHAISGNERQKDRFQALLSDEDEVPRSQGELG